MWEKFHDFRGGFLWNMLRVGGIVFWFLIFVLAYSGGSLSKMFVGDLTFASAYSGLIGTMTIVGVSFRTGLRG